MNVFNKEQLLPNEQVEKTMKNLNYLFLEVLY